MLLLKAHFDGKSIVLDEPAALTAGQALQVVVDAPANGTRFADRVLLPDFERLPAVPGDSTQAISADRDAPDGHHA